MRRVYAALQRHDADELAECVAHDIEWTLPESVPWGGTHHGHLGVISMVEVFDDHVDGLWAEPDELIEADESVVVLGRMRGTAKSGRGEFEVPFAHLWRLTDGVPSRFRAYYDTAPILAALAAGSETA
ncbi:MAG: nuclear transport factor 2 family protein [Solirubrobacterales bacterium]